MKKLIFALLLGLSIVLPVSTYAYVVKPGDTLWGLYGSNWKTVAQENGISDPKKLQVGTVLPEPNKQGLMGQFLGATAAIPNTPALIDTYLASGIAPGDTSMTLANGTTRAGTTLSGYMCFTLDVNTPVVEYVCGTASGTSVTGLMRGVDLSNPNTTSSALAFAHRRFASIQISDYPLLAILTRILQGLDSTPGGIQFGTGTIYGATTALLSSQTSSLANVEYVNNVATSGAPNASTVTKGLAEEATNAEVEAGTAAGSQARLFVNPGSWLEYADTHFSNNLAVGENVTAFNILYISSTGKYYIAHANVQNEVNRVAAVTFETVTATNFPRVYFPGSIIYGTTGMTTGSPVYLSDTGTASTTAGTLRKVIGIALGTNVWQFNPTVDTATPVPTANTIPFADAYGNIPGYNTMGDSLTAGEPLNTNDIVYVSSTGSVYKYSSSTVIYDTNLLGVVLATTSASSQVPVLFEGIVRTMNGLTAASVYYTGTVSGTISTTYTDQSIRLGVALSTTKLLLDKGKNKLYNLGLITPAASASGGAATGDSSAVSVRVNAGEKVMVLAGGTLTASACDSASVSIQEDSVSTNSLCGTAVNTNIGCNLVHTTTTAAAAGIHTYRIRVNASDGGNCTATWTGTFSVWKF